MFSKIIEKYVNNLTKDDIINFSKQQNITLNNDEIDIIYNIIKHDYKVLLYGDYTRIFYNIKSRINPTSYEKIQSIFYEYRERYKKYL